MQKIAITISHDQISDFCKKWKITEFALFGSVLRSDFNLKTSDIDVLITFAVDSNWGWELVTMKEELEMIFKKDVDLVEKHAIEKSSNEIRKKAILQSYQVIYNEAA